MFVLEVISDLSTTQFLQPFSRETTCGRRNSPNERFLVLKKKKKKKKEEKKKENELKGWSETSDLGFDLGNSWAS